MTTNETERFKWPIPEWYADWQKWQEALEDLVNNIDSNVFAVMDSTKLLMRSLPSVGIVNVSGGWYLRQYASASFISRTHLTETVIPAGDTELKQSSVIGLTFTPGAVGPQSITWEVFETGIDIAPEIVPLGYIDDDYQIIWYNGSVLNSSNSPMILFGGEASTSSGTGSDGVFILGTGTNSAKRSGAGNTTSSAYGFAMGQDNTIGSLSNYSTVFGGGPSASGYQNKIGFSSASPYSFAGGQNVVVDDTTNVGFNFSYGKDLSINTIHSNVFGVEHTITSLGAQYAHVSGYKHSIDDESVSYGTVSGSTHTIGSKSAKYGTVSGLGHTLTGGGGGYSGIFGSGHEISDASEYNMFSGLDISNGSVGEVGTVGSSSYSIWGGRGHRFGSGADYNIVGGRSNILYGTNAIYSLVSGYQNTIKSDNSQVGGYNNNFSSSYGLCHGLDNAINCEPGMIVFGSGHATTGTTGYSLIVGKDCTVGGGLYNCLIGDGNTLSGTTLSSNCSVFGSNNTMSDQQSSYIFGSDITVGAGPGTVSTVSNNFCIGNDYTVGTESLSNFIFGSGQTVGEESEWNIIMSDNADTANSTSHSLILQDTINVTGRLDYCVLVGKYNNVTARQTATYVGGYRNNVGKTADGSFVAGTFNSLYPFGSNDSTWTSVSLSAPDGSGVVTIEDLSSRFDPGMDGEEIVISGADNAVNDGTYTITYVDYQTATFTNASGIVESGASLTWALVTSYGAGRITVFGNNNNIWGNSGENALICGRENYLNGSGGYNAVIGGAKNGFSSGGGLYGLHAGNTNTIVDGSANMTVGSSNTFTNLTDSVGGGKDNNYNESSASFISGDGNIVTGTVSNSVAVGETNTISGLFSSLFAGKNNETSSTQYAFTAGYENVSDNYCGVVVGYQNEVNNDYSMVCGRSMGGYVIESVLTGYGSYVTAADYSLIACGNGAIEDMDNSVHSGDSAMIGVGNNSSIFGYHTEVSDVYGSSIGGTHIGVGLGGSSSSSIDLTYSLGNVTLALTLSPTLFSDEWIGTNITVGGCDNSANNGTFEITAATTTTITYANALGVTETSGLTNRYFFSTLGRVENSFFGGYYSKVYSGTMSASISVGDGIRSYGDLNGCAIFGVGNYTRSDSDGLLIGGTHNNTSGSNNLIIGTTNKVGLWNEGDSISLSSASGGDVTITDTYGGFSPAMDGLSITISGATNSANNGSFTDFEYISTTTATLTNASGVAESSNAKLRWSISDTTSSNAIICGNKNNAWSSGGSNGIIAGTGNIAYNGGGYNGLIVGEGNYTYNSGADNSLVFGENNKIYSGPERVIVGGSYNTVTSGSSDSIVVGERCSVGGSAYFTMMTGRQGSAVDMNYVHVHSGGHPEDSADDATVGQGQLLDRIPMSGYTDDEIPAVLYVDGAKGTKTLSLLNHLGSSVCLVTYLVAKCTETGSVKSWKFETLINTSTTAGNIPTIEGSETTPLGQTSPAAGNEDDWDASVVIDGSNVTIMVTGSTGETIRWQAYSMGPMVGVL